MRFGRKPPTPARRRSDLQRARDWRDALNLMVTIALLDWCTKAAVVATVPLGEHIELQGGRVALWHVRNPAMVLGLWGDLPLASRQTIAALCSVLAVTMLWELLARGRRFPPGHRQWTWLYVGLAFGGMLGNLGERLFLRYVTDFLSLQWKGIWLPPGNVADAAILLSLPLVPAVILFDFRGRAMRGSVSVERVAET